MVNGLVWDCFLVLVLVDRWWCCLFCWDLMLGILSDLYCWFVVWSRCVCEVGNVCIIWGGWWYWFCVDFVGGSEIVDGRDEWVGRSVEVCVFCWGCGLGW